MYANFRKNAAVLIATLLGITLITLCLMWFWNKTDTRLDHKRLLLREREQRVRGKFQQLHGTLANIDQGVMTLDSAGTVQVINRRAIELLGLPEAFSFRPLSYSDIHAFLSDREEFRDIELQLGNTAGGALKAGQPFDMPRLYERERPNGTILEVRTTEIPSGGLVRTFTDITHRKRNERAIAEARDSAETASRTQATFLAMMSHELRTPMNAVIGLTSMLIETSLDKVQRTYARIINTSAEHLLNIINNILDFSRLKAGHEKPEVAVFDVRDMIASVIEIVRSLPNAEGIRDFHQRRIQRPGLSIRRFRPGYAGAAQLSQQRGEIHEARHGRIRGSVTARHDRTVTLRFAVTNTGIGISADALPKLFVPFERGDIAQASQFGGTGLGLAISKKVVELLGGVVTVESTVGAGSTFACELPFGIADQSESRGETAGADYTGAVTESPHPGGGRYACQPNGDQGHPGEARTPGASGRQRRRSRRANERNRPRFDPDGHSDAGDERLRRRDADPADRRTARARADHRADGIRPSGRSRARPDGRHGRLPAKAHPQGRRGGDHRQGIQRGY